MPYEYTLPEGYAEAEITTDLWYVIGQIESAI